MLSGSRRSRSIEVGKGDSLVFHLNRPDGFLPSLLATTFIVDDEKPYIRNGAIPTRTKQPSTRGRPKRLILSLSEYRLHSRNSVPVAASVVVGLLRHDVDMALGDQSGVSRVLRRSRTLRVTRPFSLSTFPWFSIEPHPGAALRNGGRSPTRSISRRDCVAGHARASRWGDDPVWPFHWAYRGGQAAYIQPTLLACVCRGFRLHPAWLGVGPAASSAKCMFYNGEPSSNESGLLQRQLAAVGIDLVSRD